MSEPFVLARTAAGGDVVFRPALANRHGPIAGATGTGKTVTLQVMAEQWSRLGVPVFLADIKSDLSGIAAAGSASPKMRDRLNTIGIPQPRWRAAPVVFWDVFGRRGYPVRATISDLGPLGLLEAAARSAARSVGSGLGRAIIRGALGSILGGGRTRR